MSPLMKTRKLGWMNNCRLLKARKIMRVYADVEDFEGMVLN